MATSPATVAGQVIDVMPLVMRSIRAQVRQHRTPGLSLPQFRTLGFLDQHAGASLSDVAEHLGVTLPSMSKMVDSLVEEKLVTREFDAADRRRMILDVTPRGRSLLIAARADAQADLAHMFETLPASKRATLSEAMDILRLLFRSERETALENIK